MVKIKDIVDMKGLYSAHDVGEKEISIDVEKINQSLNIHLATNYTEKYQGLSMDWCAICGNPLTKELRKKLIMDVAQDIAKRDIIKAKP